MKKLLIITLVSMLFSCSKDSDTDETPENPTPTNAIAYIKASFNGQQFNYVMANAIAPSHYYSYGTGFTSTNVEFERAFYYSCYMAPYPQTQFYPNLDLTFHNMFKSSNYAAETAAFPSLLTSPPTNFLTAAQNENHNKGVEFSYRNSNDIYYSTQFGSQTGSTILYSSSVLGTEGGLKIQTIIGTINCKLYNENNPADVINVTNGSFKLVFKEFD